MCGEEIIRNLLEKNGGIIRFPTLCENGEIEYGGKRFTVGERELTEEDDDRPERE